MWYWVCKGNPEYNRGIFNTIKCTRSRLADTACMLYHRWNDRTQDYWVRKDVEHSDPDYKQYQCPACAHKMSKRELDSTWDWAGPHCNNCGCTGMDMFSAVTLKPIITGYQAVMGKCRAIIGKEGMDKIERGK